MDTNPKRSSSLFEVFQLLKIEVFVSLQAIRMKGERFKAGRRNTSIHKQLTGQITRPLSQTMGPERTTGSTQPQTFPNVGQLVGDAALHSLTPP